MRQKNTCTVTEETRLTALDALAPGEIGASASLQRICDTARLIFRVPIVAISIVDRNRQWTAARCGADLGAMAREEAFCNHTILGDDVLVVPDALTDQRFAAIPLVRGEPGIRFYAGAPLLAGPGVRLGSLCLLDTSPRLFTPDEAAILQKLADAATDELRRHRADRDTLVERRKLTHVVAQAAQHEDELLKQALLLSRAESIGAFGGWAVELASGSLTWSDGLFRLLGVEPGSGIDPATLFRDRVHPDDLPLLEAANRAVAEARAFEQEIRIVDREGRVRYLASRGEPVGGSDEPARRMIGSVTDISDSKAARAALEESEAHHRHAVALSPHIPWTADPSGRILEVGPRWPELTGITEREVLDKGWISAVHPDDRLSIAEAWTAATVSRRPIEAECRVRTAAGDYRWIRTRGAPRLAPDGSVLRWYGTVEDVHDRRLSEEALRRSEAFARSILDGSPDFVTVLDLDGRVRTLGRKAWERLGDDVAERVVGRSWSQGWPKSHRQEVEDAVAAARSGASRRFACSCPNRDGTEAWWDVTVDPVFDADGAVGHILAIARDRTEQERMRREIEAARQRFAQMLESTTDNVILFDRDFRVTYMNGHARRFLTETGTLETGGSLWSAYPEHDLSEVGQRLRAVLQRGVAMEFEMFTERAHQWLKIHAFPSGEDGVALFFRDVTEARLAREEIEHVASHDFLTGLANRMSFRERLEGALAEDQAMAVFLLDLDLFKEVNDTLGHPVGDALLRLVADRLGEAVAGEGLLARLGGDEFALMTQGDDEGAALALAERMVACLGSPFDVEGHVIQLGASIGVALATQKRRSADDLFKAADIALYKAKAAGGGGVQMFQDAMLERIRARQSLRQDLAAALENGELSLAYQPLLDLETDEVRTAEALLRWRHPGRGQVSPAEFIPLAEEGGLIVPIGDWVLETACQRAATWPEEMSVAVNISAVQFRCDTLPMRVAGALARSNLSPSRLELEITESVLLQDSDHNMRILHALKDLGVRIALDDFGTGFSSLSYLRLFPFDKLKLDRCFVNDIGRSAQSEAIIRAAGEMGRALAMVTTAEGVETTQQLDWLKKNGWSQAQGYLVGRPSENPLAVSAPDAAAPRQPVGASPG